LSNMVTPSSITYKEKVLLYLERFETIDREDNKEKPEDITQKGIAENLDISRTHVSRIVKKLGKEDLIEEKRSSVDGHNKRLKTYFLTRKGSEKVDELKKALSEVDVKIIGSEEERNIAVTDLKEETDGELDPLKALSILKDSEENEIDMHEYRPIEPVQVTEEIPKVEELYGRDEELQKIRGWLERNTPIMAVLGRRGQGSTSLVATFIEEVKKRHILWVDLEKKSSENFKKELFNFLKEIGDVGLEKNGETLCKDEILSQLLKQEAILVLDDYHKVKDEIVQFLNQLMRKIEESQEKTNLRLIITGRVGTPFYNRFYQKEHLEKNLVKEMKLTSLDKKDAQKILDKDIEDEALERIMMFTKGSPLLLKLLKEENEEKLIEITPWEEEQISLLMFLKTKNKN